MTLKTPDFLAASLTRQVAVDGIIAPSSVHSNRFLEFCQARGDRRVFVLSRFREYDSSSGTSHLLTPARASLLSACADPPASLEASRYLDAPVPIQVLLEFNGVHALLLHHSSGSASASIRTVAVCNSEFHFVSARSSWLLVACPGPSDSHSLGFPDSQNSKSNR